MELQERINILTQGAELAQKNGALTLDDAYYAKQAIDALKGNVAHKAAFDILTKIANAGQKKGVYTLRDAYLLYLATENIESVIPTPVHAQPAQAPQPAPAQVSEKKTPRTKKES